MRPDNRSLLAITLTMLLWGVVPKAFACQCSGKREACLQRNYAAIFVADVSVDEPRMEGRH